jgi:transaldolase
VTPDGSRVMERLGQLHDAGVSIWLDTLSRDLLTSGEFQRLVNDWSVTGATSNPTIFATAIRGADTYDAQVRARLSDGAGRERERHIAVRSQPL